MRASIFFVVFFTLLSGLNAFADTDPQDAHMCDQGQLGGNDANASVNNLTGGTLSFRLLDGVTRHSESEKSDTAYVQHGSYSWLHNCTREKADTHLSAMDEDKSYCSLKFKETRSDFAATFSMTVKKVQVDQKRGQITLDVDSSDLEKVTCFVRPLSSDQLKIGDLATALAGVGFDKAAGPGEVTEDAVKAPSAR